MRVPVAFAVAALLIAGAAAPAAAQNLTFRGFASGGSASDVNGETVPAFGGGLLVDLGQPWVAAGVQGDVFTSNGYFAGRGAVFGQVSPLRNLPFRPFVLGGVGFGEYAGGLVGLGVELSPAKSRVGLRLALEDYVTRYDLYNSAFQPAGRETSHQISVKVGVVF